MAATGTVVGSAVHHTSVRKVQSIERAAGLALHLVPVMALVRKTGRIGQAAGLAFHLVPLVRSPEQLYQPAVAVCEHRPGAPGKALLLR